MKTTVILQSNYMPWKGYFDLIHDANLFVFYDDVQYTVRDWRNRNKIKTEEGLRWLSVPVHGGQNCLIYEVGISDEKWERKHWESIKHAYSKAPFFKKYSEFFQELYFGEKFKTLSEFNQHAIKKISHELLGINTEFQDSRFYNIEGSRTDRLIKILQKSKSTRYISGPAARAYIEESKFNDAGIELVYKDYEGYPEYKQVFGDFSHGVTILDLIFNVGPEAPYYIWGWRKSSLA